MIYRVVLTTLLVALLAVAYSTTPPVSATTQAPAVQAELPALQTTPVATGFGDILKAVQERGNVKCGVNTANPGFSFLDPSGKWSGLDTELCAAIALAIFNDPTKVEFTPTTGETRFTMVQNGDIDVLIRSTTHTFTRDIELALNFTDPYFYDGQGIMVTAESGITQLEDLDGGSICMGRGATTELNIADAMNEKGLTYTPVLFDDPNDVIATYEQGRCDAMTNDKSGLMAQRSITQNPDDHVILDATLSKEPLAAAVRHGDDQWRDLVQWVIYVTWIAEEKGITQANVDEIKGSTEDAEIRRLLGLEEEMGKKLGLSNDYAYNIIKGVGNFGEIYDRNLGPDTPTYIPRANNNLWTNGGLLYAPPYR